MGEAIYCGESDRPPLRFPKGCVCAYAWRSLGRVYGQEMGATWVRATTERECPVHGDDRPYPSPEILDAVMRVIQPAETEEA